MSVDRDYLKRIVEATKANQPAYVGQVIGQPMLALALIEIEPAIQNPADPTQVLCRALFPAADIYLAANVNGGAEKSAGNYAIITNAALPEAKKRGNFSGSGAPTKYPFAEMAVGSMFFSADTEHAKGNALKALGSTVSAQNDKNSVQKQENGQPVFKTVTRAVRDKTTKKAQIGPDGKKVTETVQLPVKAYDKKFTIRAVEAGKVYGQWTAPANGALVARTV